MLNAISSCRLQIWSLYTKVGQPGSQPNWVFERADRVNVGMHPSGSRLAGQRTWSEQYGLSPAAPQGPVSLGSTSAHLQTMQQFSLQKESQGSATVPRCKANVSKNRPAVLSDPGSSLPEAFCDVSPPLQMWKEWNFYGHRVLRSRSCISLEVWLCIWFTCVHFVCIVFEKISWKTRCSCWWCCTVSRVFASGTWSSTYQKWNFIWTN